MRAPRPLRFGIAMVAAWAALAVPGAVLAADGASPAPVASPAAGLTPPEAFADPEPDPEPTPDPFRPKKVIQERLYQPRHEFRLGLGYLPQDPFWKGYGPELAYVWHVGDWVEWEVLRAAYFVHLDSEIRRQVAAEFDIAKDPYEKVGYMVFSHVRWAPFYGRYTVLNRGVTHQETFLSAGAGMIGWTEAEGPRADGVSPGEGGFRPAFDVGLGFRFYTSRRTSLTIEVQDQFIMRYDGSLGSQFYLTIGGSFATPRKTRPASVE